MLLSLVMIVKNEACGILRTLESVRPLCNRFDIVDTGSTDGTVDIIERCAAKSHWPGEITRTDFVDFGTTRTLALMRARADWCLMLSGDEVMTDGSRENIVSILDSATTAWDVTVQHGDYQFQHPRLTRFGQARYVGKTHERLVCAESRHPAFPMRIQSGRRDEDRTARYEEDLDILLAELPATPRRNFYLGQTFQGLKRWFDAIECYRRCYEITRDPDERFEVALRLGQLDQIFWLDRASNIFPYRAEPHFYLAQCYRRRGDLERANQALRKAEACHFPVGAAGLIHLNAYAPRIATERAVLNQLMHEPCRRGTMATWQDADER